MCRLPNIAMCDYKESVTTGQTNRQTPDKVIPISSYASQATQKLKIMIVLELTNYNSNHVRFSSVSPSVSSIFSICSLRVWIFSFFFFNLSLSSCISYRILFLAAMIFSKVLTFLSSTEIMKIQIYFSHVVIVILSSSTLNKIFTIEIEILPSPLFLERKRLIYITRMDGITRHVCEYAPIGNKVIFLNKVMVKVTRSFTWMSFKMVPLLEHIHTKYEFPIYYGSKVMAQVKVFKGPTDWNWRPPI